MTGEDWMAILKLATLWDMPDTHAQAVASLDEEIQKRAAGEKIALAMRYGVKKWFKDGFKAFVTGRENISIEERERIGWETYARLLEAKDKAWHQCFPAHYQRIMDSGHACYIVYFGGRSHWRRPCEACRQLLDPTETPVLAGLTEDDCEKLWVEVFGSV